MANSAFIDTSFLIRLLNEEDALHQNAVEYFNYFNREKFILKVSTIAVAEYCTRGDFTDLPLDHLQIIPFNLNHAIKAAEFAKIVFENKKNLKIPDRKVIHNDVKLFAQTNTENYFISSDTGAKSMLDLIAKVTEINFKFIDIFN